MDTSNPEFANRLAKALVDAGVISSLAWRHGKHSIEMAVTQAIAAVKYEIPVLPKKEIPEEGYRAIRDALIDNFGPHLSKSKTTSEQVIEILERSKEYPR